MKFGLHVSIEGGIEKAPQRAFEIGAECFQIFSRPPQGGPPLKFSSSQIERFKKQCQKYQLSEYYIHTPYFINLGSTNNRIYYGSISAIKHDLEIGSSIKAQFVMTHLGSAKELGPKKTLFLVEKALQKIFENYQGTTQLLIEMSSGAGKIIGDRFEEIAEIICLVKEKPSPLSLGVCFDTAHAFESGYDLRTLKTVQKALDQFDKIIGLECLKLIHVNDSKTELGSHKDRHENIGEGQIGLLGFRALIQEPRLSKINMILETPDEDKDKENLEKLKEIRDEKT